MIQIDMHMPKNCIECPIHDGEYGWCDLDADIAMNCDDRPDNCPLHEVTSDEDTISRQAVIDAILAVTGNSSVRELYEHVQEHGLSDMWSGGVNAAIDIIIAVPSAQPDLIAKIQNGINATNANDSYSCGMRNGMRWCMSLVDDKEPLFENCPSAQPEQCKFEYHYDHTDCIWYRPGAQNRCPVTCAQYRDGWNDAMNYIFRDGKGYRPYRRDKQYGE